MTDPREVVTRSAEEPDVVLRYDNHAGAVIDVFLPASLGRPEKPSPMIVLVHGGFWRQEFDRVHVRPLANALKQRGLVVAVPEYRRVADQSTWPQTGGDVDRALAAIPSMLDEAAPDHIDPAAPCVLTGHSAGGHLALWAGLRADPGRVGSIVALAPVSDLRYAARVRMGDGAVQALLGGEPHERPDNYAEADVVGLLPGIIDVTIIQGTDDKQVAVEMNRRLAATHSGTSLRYMELEGVDHFALIDPLSAVFEAAVLPALTKRRGRPRRDTPRGVSRPFDGSFLPSRGEVRRPLPGRG